MRTAPEKQLSDFRDFFGFYPIDLPEKKHKHPQEQKRSHFLPFFTT